MAVAVHSQDGELLDVLTRTGEKTGVSKLRGAVHREGEYHRAVHVWIYSETTRELLLQKRADCKDSWPGQWDVSSAGHISSGDSSLVTARRELQEELGIKLPKDAFEIIFVFLQECVINDGKYINNEFNDVYLVTTLAPIPVEAFTLQDIFAGGSGTSASAMMWTMSELIQNPRVMKKAKDEVRRVVEGKPKITESDIKELNYLRLVIKEAMRLHPPAPLLVPRLTTDKFEIQGHDIPLKTQVVFNAYAMARDPNFWDEPEAFKPERFEESLVDFKGTNYEFIPFGAGRRLCPGIMFGLVGMEIALANLLYYFDWSLPEGMTRLDMSEISGLGARRKYDLCLCPTPFIPLPLDTQ